VNIENITSDDITLTYNGLTMQKNIYEQEIKRLNNIINKAIEYIENKNKYLESENYYQVFEYRDIYLMPLLNILEGSDKE